MNNETCILKIEDLTFGWDDELLFDDVSAALEQAVIVRLTGANGSGKTTLLKLIAGALPHFARGKILEGEIFLYGSSVFSNPPRSFFPNIAYVPDSHVELFYFTKSLAEEMVIVQSTLGLADSQIAEQLGRFTDFFPDFKKIITMPFPSMSNAQRQLALLFIYFLQDAHLFLIDEISPCAFFAASAYQSFYAFLRMSGKTVIFASQDDVVGCDIEWKILDKKLVAG